MDSTNPFKISKFQLESNQFNSIQFNSNVQLVLTISFSLFAAATSGSKREIERDTFSTVLCHPHVDAALQVSLAKSPSITSTTVRKRTPVTSATQHGIGRKIGESACWRLDRRRATDSRRRRRRRLWSRRRRRGTGTRGAASGRHPKPQTRHPFQLIARVSDTRSCRLHLNTASDKEATIFKLTRVPCSITDDKYSNK